MKVAVLLGAPGSGKGTQAKTLVESNQFKHYSTGDMLRAAIKQGTEVGVQAKTFIDRGDLVPDETMIKLIQDTFADLDSSSKVLLDGFPRTVPQADALDKDELTRVGLALYFKVPESDLITRLTGRRLCKDCGASYHVAFIPPKVEGVCDKCGGTDLIQRTDDTEEVVVKRLQVYENQTAPLLKYYQDKDILKSVDAAQAPDAVTESVRGQLGSWAH